MAARFTSAKLEAGPRAESRGDFGGWRCASKAPRVLSKRVATLAHASNKPFNMLVSFRLWVGGGAGKEHHAS